MLRRFNREPWSENKQVRCLQAIMFVMVGLLGRTLCARRLWHPLAVCERCHGQLMFTGFNRHLGWTCISRRQKLTMRSADLSKQYVSVCHRRCDVLVSGVKKQGQLAQVTV